MQELLEVRVEAVAETDGVGDSLDAVGRAGQEMRSLSPARQRVARQSSAFACFASSTVSDGSMLNAISV